MHKYRFCTIYCLLTLSMVLMASGMEVVNSSAQPLTNIEQRLRERLSRTQQQLNQLLLTTPESVTLQNLRGAQEAIVQLQLKLTEQEQILREFNHLAQGFYTSEAMQSGTQKIARAERTALLEQMQSLNHRLTIVLTENQRLHTRISELIPLAMLAKEGQQTVAKLTSQNQRLIAQIQQGSVALPAMPRAVEPPIVESKIPPADYIALQQVLQNQKDEIQILSARATRMQGSAANLQKLVIDVYKTLNAPGLLNQLTPLTEVQQQDLSDMAVSWQNMTQMMQSIRNIVERVERDNTRLTEQNQQLQLENRALSQKIAELTTALDAVQTKLQVPQVDEQLRKEREKLIGELTQLQEVQRLARTQVSTIQELESQRLEHVQQISELQHKVTGLQQNLDAKTVSLATPINAEIQVLEGELKELRTKAQEQQQIRQVRLAQLAKEAESADAQLLVVSKNYTQVLSERDQLRYALQDAVPMATVQQQRVQSETTIANLKEQLKAATEKAQELQNTITNISDSKQRLDSRYQAIVREHEASAANEQAAQLHLQQLQEQLSQVSILFAQQQQLIGDLHLLIHNNDNGNDQTALVLAQSDLIQILREARFHDQQRVRNMEMDHAQARIQMQRQLQGQMTPQSAPVRVSPIVAPLDTSRYEGTLSRLEQNSLSLAKTQEQMSQKWVALENKWAQQMLSAQDTNAKLLQSLEQSAERNLNLSKINDSLKAEIAQAYRDLREMSVHSTIRLQ